MENFWEHKHASKDGYWISDTNHAKYVLDIQKVDTEISGKQILDIGIGLGHVAKHFNERGNNVICADISQTALDNVKSFAATYHTSDLNKIEPVDLAMCNLVFQHCEDSEVQRIIQDVNLKDGGIFSFQFAFLREPPNEQVKGLIANGKHFFRSLDTIKGMIDNSNKKLLRLYDPIHHYHPENFSWYVVHLTNK